MAVTAAQAVTPRARLETMGARVVGALPPAAKRRIAGAPIRLDGLELDLDMQVLVKLAERDLRPLAGHTPAEAREHLREAVRPFEGPPVPLASVRETTLAGAAGALRARLYEPEETHIVRDGARGPLIVYYHGGGWVTGDLDTHERPRSEEHTSELQSHSDLVCRLLLEKKKTEIHDMCIRKGRVASNEPAPDTCKNTHIAEFGILPACQPPRQPPSHFPRSTTTA